MKFPPRWFQQREELSIWFLIYVVSLRHLTTTSWNRWLPVFQLIDCLTNWERHHRERKNIDGRSGTEKATKSSLSRDLNERYGSLQQFVVAVLGKKLDSTSGNRGEKTRDVDVLINSLKRDTRLSRDVPLHQNSGTQQEMEKGQKIL